METPTTEGELVDAAVRVLTLRLPSAWSIDKQPSAGDPEVCDLVFKSPNTGSQALVLVEAKNDVTPRDVETLIGGPWRRWRKQTGNHPILVVAPYMGPRVRELLAEGNVSFIDLTGNMRISLDYPGVFIETQGAASDPRSGKVRRTAIRGAKAGAVVRVLIDVAPPYSGAQIARAAQVNEGYVSRILDTLVDEGLVGRERAGPVTGVDWPRLVRRRAEALDLFRANGSFRYVARQGATELLERLRSRSPDDPVPTVTGSFAASRLAPVAAPSLLTVYSMTPRQLEAELELLPAEAGADVVLIRPDNLVAFARSDADGGIAWAAPSQTAIDCLSGSGRMPSEGEALIEWMRQDETRWRAPSIELFDAAPSGAG
ncbi:MAG: hypothetical protein M3010_10380 [Candidatus Dormibacteraeota bacterium]|nr:hypothetical protein [Candidatus Dormibacteraeota bacterium]